MLLQMSVKENLFQSHKHVNDDSFFKRHQNHQIQARYSRLYHCLLYNYLPFHQNQDLLPFSAQYLISAYQ